MVIGHSLGGLLLRAALADLPPGSSRPDHLFLVGSPSRSPRLARRLKRQCVFRLLSGDAGRLLADPHRMQRIPPPALPVTVIAGVRGMPHAFKGKPNDGIVTLAETRVAGQGEALRVASVHTFLLNSAEVFRIILARCAAPPASGQRPNQP